MCSPHDLDEIEARQEGKKDMKDRVNLLRMALEASKKEAQETVRKLNESLRALDEVDVDLAMHSKDDVNVAIMKLQFAAALPAGTPNLDRISAALGKAVESLTTERERMFWSQTES